MPGKAGGEKRRTARCACGSLRIELVGNPRAVYLCHCDTCKRTTGSVFAYRARYSASAIAHVSDGQRSWRRQGESGSWVDQVFCGSCGSTLFLRGERLGSDIVVSAGAFAETDLPAPQAAYYQDREMLWLHDDGHFRR
jgi:hypothetical protein